MLAFIKSLHASVSCLHLTLPPPESCLVRRSTLMAVVTIMLVAINIFGEKEGRRKSGISTTMKKLLNGCNCFKRKLVYSGASLSEGINLWGLNITRDKNKIICQLMIILDLFNKRPLIKGSTVIN